MARVHRAITRYGLLCSICHKPIEAGEYYTVYNQRAKHKKCRKD